MGYFNELWLILNELCLLGESRWKNGGIGWKERRKGGENERNPKYED